MRPYRVHRAAGHHRPDLRHLPGSQARYRVTPAGSGAHHRHRWQPPMDGALPVRPARCCTTPLVLAVVGRGACFTILSPSRGILSCPAMPVRKKRIMRKLRAAGAVAGLCVTAACSSPSAAAPAAVPGSGGHSAAATRSAPVATTEASGAAVMHAPVPKVTFSRVPAHGRLRADHSYPPRPGAVRAAQWQPGSRAQRRPGWCARARPWAAPSANGCWPPSTADSSWPRGSAATSRKAT